MSESDDELFGDGKVNSAMLPTDMASVLDPADSKSAPINDDSMCAVTGVSLQEKQLRWLIVAARVVGFMHPRSHVYRNRFICLRIITALCLLAGIVLFSMSTVSVAKRLRKTTDIAAFVLFQFCGSFATAVVSFSFGTYYWWQRPADIERIGTMVEENARHRIPIRIRRHILVLAALNILQWIDYIMATQFDTAYSRSSAASLQELRSDFHIPEWAVRLCEVLFPLIFYNVLYTMIATVAITIQFYVIAFRTLRSRVRDLTCSEDALAFMADYRMWRRSLSITCKKVQMYLGPMLLLVFVGLVMTIFLSFQLSGVIKKNNSGECPCFGSNGTFIHTNNTLPAPFGGDAQGSDKKDGVTADTFIRESVRLALFMMAPLLYFIYHASELTSSTDDILDEVNDKLSDRDLERVYRPVWHVVQTGAGFTVYGVTFSRELFMNIIIVIFSASSVVIHNAL